MFCMICMCVIDLAWNRDCKNEKPSVITLLPAVMHDACCGMLGRHIYFSLFPFFHKKIICRATVAPSSSVVRYDTVRESRIRSQISMYEIAQISASACALNAPSATKAGSGGWRYHRCYMDVHASSVHGGGLDKKRKEKKGKGRNMTVRKDGTRSAGTGGLLHHKKERRKKNRVEQNGIDSSSIRHGCTSSTRHGTARLFVIACFFFQSIIHSK